MGYTSSKKYFDSTKNKKEKLPKYSSEYFRKINKILMKEYKENAIENLSLPLNNLNSSTNIYGQKKIIKIEWIDYIYDFAEKQISKGFAFLEEFITALDKEEFLDEYNCKSFMFYKNFQIITFPNALKDFDVTKENYFKKTLSAELSVASNLGGSVASQNLSQNSDSIMRKYRNGRIKNKKFIRAAEQDLCSKEHPIIIIIKLFSEAFCNYLSINKHSLENEKFEENFVQEKFGAKINLFYKDVNYILQKFITAAQVSLKLFYKNTVDFQTLAEEKEELSNLITTIIFRNEKLYNLIFEIYSLKFEKQKRLIEKNMNILLSSKPEDFQVRQKFCLNHSTLVLQEEILKKEKEKNKNKNKNNSGSKEEDRIESKTESRKNTLLNQKKNNESQGQIIMNCPLYTVSSFNISEISNLSNKYGRFTTAVMDPKVFEFPALHKAVRESICIKANNINDAKNSKDLPKPYSIAVQILKSLNQYRAPLEQVLVICSINDEIKENITTFWKELDKYVTSKDLEIEADDLLSIYRYIIAQTQMSELIVIINMIRNFISKSIRDSSKIGYYFSMVEASVSSIEELKFPEDMNISTGIRNDGILLSPNESQC